jgi:hypothetical protein
VGRNGSDWARSCLIWAALVTAIAVPIVAAANSPLIAWRDSIYIAAGFAGIIGLAFLLLQPLLAAGYLPGLRAKVGHRLIGGLLVAAVILHVAGLWITSPPDVIDALLFVSPTPFSVWGVMAMWAVFATALLAVFRRRLRLRPRLWRGAHAGLALAIASGTVVHALLIEGTMETVSKAVLCVLVLIATVKVAVDVWRRPQRAR